MTIRTTASTTAATETAPSSDSDPSTSSGPLVLGTSAANTELNLANFFNPDSDWSENEYNVADQKDIQGIGASVSECALDQAEQLELRLGDNFSTLSFKVGESDDSPNAQALLTVVVLKEGIQAVVKKIPDNVIQSFSVPVTGTNAVDIDFFLDPSTCDEGPATAVVEDATVS